MLEETKSDRGLTTIDDLYKPINHQAMMADKVEKIVPGFARADFGTSCIVRMRGGNIKIFWALKRHQKRLKQCLYYPEFARNQGGKIIVSGTIFARQPGGNCIGLPAQNGASRRRKNDDSIEIAGRPIFAGGQEVAGWQAIYLDVPAGSII